MGKEDLISRQDTIEAVEYLDWYHQNKNGEMVHGANGKEDQPWYKAQDIYDALEKLPSAQPEQRWIPCEERLPEPYITVLATMEDNELPEIKTVDVVTPIRNRENGSVVWPPAALGNYIPHLNMMEYKVIAWMPLPEPFRRSE